jgi:hypothetical protein
MSAAARRARERGRKSHGKKCNSRGAVTPELEKITAALAAVGTWIHSVPISSNQSLVKSLSVAR